MIEIRDTTKVSDIPASDKPVPVPVGDYRFSTRDIRLSSALCALGFSLKIDRQPVSVTIDANTERRIIDFYHDDRTTHPKLQNISARDVDLWWRSPLGKFTIDGFDDALEAIRRVFREREGLIAVSKNPKPFSTNGAKVDTDSLHKASILSACDIPLTGYEPKMKRWVFGKGAEVIYNFIIAGGKPKEPRPIANDLCIDWMLAALKYRDWLIQLVKHPDCIPIIEMREGKKILQISSGMDEHERRKWISYL